MPPAPLPANERQRLAALSALSILDTPADEVFESFVRVACGLFDAPIGAVSLVAEDRQWFKAVAGLNGMTTTPRDQSFCAYTILDAHKTMAVPDATLDARFCDNPLVTGEQGIRFYAGAPLTDADGHALGALCVLDKVPRAPSPAQMTQLRDIATGVSAALRLHGALRQLDNQAHCDTLTGLNNRRAFDRALAASTGSGVTLLLLDMDGFKDINDTFGHPAGDIALQEVARRLSDTIRYGDQAFRLGGDEFAVVLPEPMEHDELRTFADRLRAALAVPFELDGRTMDLGASIGAATLAPGAADASLLVPRADAALYGAKRAGRGFTRIAGETDVDACIRPNNGVPGRRHSLKVRLKQALVPPGAEPFQLVFQPVVGLRDFQVRTLEALTRWSPEPGDNVPPSEFVRLAERTGLAPHLDTWVLRTACAAAQRWPSPRGVSVNISPLTLGAVDVPGLVRDTLQATGLTPERLTIELTETALAEDPAQAGRHVDALRALGVGIALDDFGAGHASLVALRSYAFTKLKIDRAIVSCIDLDPVQRRSVEFIAELGRMLGLTVVAEGVERSEEMEVLRACGVDECQGYLFARPAAASSVERAVKNAIRVASTELGHDAAA